ncbi:hypothetical protein [Streptomyces sp. SID11385]|uniref:hypothetical protein n=1 Tax=Streptomyces sp. SID11385 TaxID=2706031 RepID=UPI0013CCC2CD|nr:hypothetical protein [Streptomyces sp. SID11385]NEA42493.1 hypothetical protein [Streptomyces sp. SID11385]
MPRSPRLLLSVVALAATTALLTSCQDDDSGDAKAGNAAAASPASPSAPSPSSPSSPAETSPASPSASQPAETPGDTGGGTAGATGSTGDGQPEKVYWEGVSHYLAPGKYSVTDDTTKKERAFLTSTKTVINGNGWICGTEEKTQRCTAAQLDAATKKGKRLVVKIAADGTAVTIDEQHN